MKILDWAIHFVLTTENTYWMNEWLFIPIHTDSCEYTQKRSYLEMKCLWSIMLSLHINYISFKLRLSFLLNKASNILDYTSLKVLYYYNYFNVKYCCEMWGNIYKKNSIHCLYLLKKRVTRNIYSQWLSGLYNKCN